MQTGGASARRRLAARSTLVPLCAAVLALAHQPAFAAENSARSAFEASANGELTPDTQLRLAQTYAPVLVFHPLERYFPTSPLFPIEDGTRQSSGGAAQGAPTTLGTTASRREQYEKLTRAGKAAIATVFYRAYWARHRAEDVIVVEYWLYYVHDEYRVRGNLLPFWVDGSHPNDLEHIHVILRPGTDGELTPLEVYASSHQGTIPANRYQYASGDMRERRRFLVELGSHALAPDVDEDGVFTPGSDGRSGYKLLWGIRDRGITWMRPRRSYMDSRNQPDALVLSYVEEGGSAATSYRLVPVQELDAAFARLNLTGRERKDIFETSRHWFRRTFGSDNGSSAKLLVPPARRSETQSIGIDNAAASERGFLVGTVFNLEEQGALVGARYAFLNGIRFVPDLVLQANGVASKNRAFVSSEVMASYPIDGSTKLMIGKALVTDSLRFDRAQWDWVAGVEVRLGHMRIYGASRSWGPITGFAKEFRLAYFF